MNWILIAVVAGSIVTSGHETKEACMGRVATLQEQKITAACYSAPAPAYTSSSTNVFCITNCTLPVGR